MLTSRYDEKNENGTTDLTLLQMAFFANPVTK